MVALVHKAEKDDPLHVHLFYQCMYDEPQRAPPHWEKKGRDRPCGGQKITYLISKNKKLLEYDFENMTDTLTV